MDKRHNRRRRPRSTFAPNCRVKRRNSRCNLPSTPGNRCRSRTCVRKQEGARPVIQVCSKCKDVEAMPRWRERNQKVGRDHAATSFALPYRAAYGQHATRQERGNEDERAAHSHSAGAYTAGLRPHLTCRSPQRQAGQASDVLSSLKSNSIRSLDSEPGLGAPGAALGRWILQRGDRLALGYACRRRRRRRFKALAESVARWVCIAACYFLLDVACVGQLLPRPAACAPN